MTKLQEFLSHKITKLEYYKEIADDKKKENPENEYCVIKTKSGCLDIIKKTELKKYHIIKYETN